MSGGLDRLSAEEDPCVRYDQTSRLWIYLHGKRTIDSPKWQTDINEAGKKANEQKNIPSNLGKDFRYVGGTSNETTDVGHSPF